MPAFFVGLIMIYWHYFNHGNLSQENKYLDK